MFVDWIKNDGKSYINIDNINFHPSSFNILLNARFSLLSSSSNESVIFNGPELYWFHKTSYTDSRNRYISFNGNIFYQESPVKKYEFNTPHYWELHVDGDNNYSVTMDGGYAGLWSPRFSPFISILKIFGNTTNYNNPIKFYGMSLRKSISDPIIINLKPCYYEGEYGLWDTINKKFYSNSGTGTITGGYD